MGTIKTILTPLDLREIQLIDELRKMKFGSIEVFKENGVIVRIINRESKRMSEEEGARIVGLDLSVIAISKK